MPRQRISEEDLARLELRYAELRKQFPNRTRWMDSRTPTQIESLFRAAYEKEQRAFRRKLDRIYAKLSPELRSKVEEGEDLTDAEWAEVEHAKAKSTLFRAGK
jgi:hypothetical protein